MVVSHMFRSFTYYCLYLPHITRGNGALSRSHMFTAGGTNLRLVPCVFLNLTRFFGNFDFQDFLWNYWTHDEDLPVIYQPHINRQRFVCCLEKRGHIPHTTFKVFSKSWTAISCLKKWRNGTELKSRKYPPATWGIIPVSKWLGWAPHL